MKFTALTNICLKPPALKLVSLMTALLLAGICAITPGLAQPQATAPPQYAMLEYMKIESGKAADYLRMERDIWMPIHRERIKQGLIKSWTLWSMRFPGGTSREYDAIAITTFAKFADIENSYPPEVFKRAHAQMTDEERNARTTATRKMVRTEVVTVLDSTTPTASTQPPRYAFIGYMQPEYGKTRQYVELERQYWKQIHQERVGRGILRAWTLYNVRFPGGSDRAYSHFTIQLLDQFHDLETQYPAGIWDKVHPNVRQDEIDARTNAARKMVRTDVLTLLEQVP